MANKFLYSDLDKDLEMDRNGNVRISYDEDAITQSIKTIMAVASGERVRSTFGGSLLPLLFQPIDEYLEDDLRRELTFMIESNEPRVTIQAVNITMDRDNSIIAVQLSVNIKKINRTMQFRTKLRSFA